MTKIVDLNKKTMTALRPDIDAALAELGARLGLKLTAGNGSFAGNTAHFKLNIEVDDPAIKEAAARAEFERYCSLYQLEPTDFGVEFNAGSKRYRLLGLQLSRSKYPLRVLDIAANKEVLLTDAAVLHIKMARTTRAAA